MPQDGRDAPGQSSLPLAGLDGPRRDRAGRVLPELNRFSTGDAFAFLAGLPDASVDLVVTDPPYESLQLHRAKGTTTRLVGDWFDVIPDARLPELLSEVARVLKPDRHFYLFCDEITADVIKEQQGITSRREPDGSRACRSGLSYWRELIWAKTTGEGTKIHGGMGYHYRSACERILFFEKGKRRLNDLGIPDVLCAPRPTHQAPAAKPLEVCRILVEQSTAAGELVVDPFAGSGVVGLAALETGRTFLLNDLDASYLLPEVKAVAAGRSPKFLLITPTAKDPESFMSAWVEAGRSGKPWKREVRHDAEMLGLDTDAGRALCQKLAETREVEREAIWRRYLRTTTWAQAARARAGEPGLHPRVTDWLEWIGR